MAAEIINQVLAEEAGRIAEDILLETTHSSPWIDLQPTGLFPEGMGDTIKILTFGRSFPATAQGVMTGGTWTTLDNTYGAAGGGCLPTVTNVQAGSTTAEFSLFQTALESDPLCVNNLRHSFQRQKQLDALRNNLAEATKHVLIERTRDQYASLLPAANQVLVAANGVTTGTDGTMASGAGKSPGVITGELLTKYYDKLVFNGAGNSKMLLREDGGPIFPFITSMLQSDIIKRATSNGTRDDYRWNPSVSEELLKIYSGLGAMSKPLRGFQHIVDVLPPRWEWSNSAWNRVWPYVRVAGSNGAGYVYVENPNYETAAWEDSFIYHPEVMKMLFPSTITNAGGGATFQPVQYRGEWVWNNVKNLDSASAAYNPDGTIGRFRAVFMTATEPVKQRFGVRIRHARCINNNQLYAACS